MMALITLSMFSRYGMALAHVQLGQWADADADLAQALKVGGKKKGKKGKGGAAAIGGDEEFAAGTYTMVRPNFFRPALLHCTPPGLSCSEMPIAHSFVRRPRFP